MARKPTELRPLMLRIPEALRKRIEVEATKNDRSMNSEIINRLQNSFQKGEQAVILAGVVREAFVKAFDMLRSAKGEPNSSIDPELPETAKKQQPEAKAAAAVRTRGKGTP
jgi:Arc-like DNA binding domain